MPNRALTEPPLEPYPERSGMDAARVGMDASLAAIPLVGGSVQILVEGFLGPAFDRRRDRWFRALGEMMNELSERVEALASDEVFITAVFEASRIAVGTHLEEKLRMLRNCLINVATVQVRDDFMALQMIRLVESIEPEHVAVLEYFRNPRGWYEKRDLTQPSHMSGSRRAVMNEAGLPIVGAALDIVLRHLGDFALLDTGAIDGMVTANAMWQELTTDLGNTFLDFVLGAENAPGGA